MKYLTTNMPFDRTTRNIWD